MEIDISSVRLECLKLCNRHDLHPGDVVTRAKVFENYVLNLKAEPVEKEPKVEVKKQPLVKK